MNETAAATTNVAQRDGLLAARDQLLLARERLVTARERVVATEAASMGGLSTTATGSRAAAVVESVMATSTVETSMNQSLLILSIQALDNDSNDVPNDTSSLPLPPPVSNINSDLTSSSNKHEDAGLIENRMPLAASCLDITMKKRCVDISLSLIQKISDNKKKAAEPDSGKSSIDGQNPTPTPTPTPVPTSAEATPSLTPTLDTTVPQGACQLLIHVLREEDVRTYFKGVGGAHRIMTSIPPFEGNSKF